MAQTMGAVMLGLMTTVNIGTIDCTVSTTWGFELRGARSWNHGIEKKRDETTSGERAVYRNCTSVNGIV